MLDFRHEVVSAMDTGHLHVSYIVIDLVLFFKRRVSVKPAKLLLLLVIWLPSWISSTHRRPTISELLLMEKLTRKHSGSQGLKKDFSCPSGQVLVSFGWVQHRSGTNFQMTDYTKLSNINQQRCCSVPFLLCQHCSAGIVITSGSRSHIPIQISNDSDE